MVTYGYLEAEYKDYLADLTGDGIITDNSGLIPRNTPENTFGITTSYTTQIGQGELKGRISYRFRDEMNSDSSNNPLCMLGEYYIKHTKCCRLILLSTNSNKFVSVSIGTTYTRHLLL